VVLFGEVYLCILVVWVRLQPLLAEGKSLGEVEEFFVVNCPRHLTGFGVVGLSGTQPFT